MLPEVRACTRDFGAESNPCHRIHILKNGALERTRTSDPQLRKLMLYPLSYERLALKMYPIYDPNHLPIINTLCTEVLACPNQMTEQNVGEANYFKVIQINHIAPATKMNL